MCKTCGTCNHKAVCAFVCESDNSNNCPAWQKFRYYGKWIKIKDGFRCSECCEEACAQFSYCPDCGASMMYEVL